MSGLFAGKQLLKKDGSTVGPETLDGPTVALYFSSSWCPDCQPVSSKLATFYEIVNEDEKVFEVVFVSSDDSVEMQLEYMNNKHADWLALDCTDELTAELKRKYNTFAGREVEAMGGIERKNGIPTLILIDAEGNCLSDDGVAMLEKNGSKGMKAFKL
jgi:cytochrome oxidase Cu insertion factor (SCO1/SenC/PrrC family)